MVYSIAEWLLIEMNSAADTVFKTLADPTRRSLLERLCREGEQTVWMLTRHARISQPAVSKHLAALKAAGLVRDRREGRETHYRAETKGLSPLVDWLSLYGAFWRDRLDRLEDLLQRMDK
jgi:DNA-binding transcriptional ArsR family regulator